MKYYHEQIITLTVREPAKNENECTVGLSKLNKYPSWDLIGIPYVRWVVNYMITKKKTVHFKIP